MKLSISNIGWTAEEDEKTYLKLKQLGFSGVEVAPTRVFGTDPYDKKDEARKYRKYLEDSYGLNVSSIQSIWFGRNERVFGSNEERRQLVDYTKKAIDFAEILGCENLVFGCPKNRVMSDVDKEDIAIDFFRELGLYAAQHNTILALEANPTIYNTNFMIRTDDAFRVAKLVAVSGCKVNLDFGTMIENKESVDIVEKYVTQINHIHISEPWLKVIEQREDHKRLKKILTRANYSRYVSVEMGKEVGYENVMKSIEYLKEIFG